LRLGIETQRVKIYAEIWLDPKRWEKEKGKRGKAITIKETFQDTNHHYTTKSDGGHTMNRDCEKWVKRISEVWSGSDRPAGGRG